MLWKTIRDYYKRRSIVRSDKLRRVHYSVITCGFSHRLWFSCSPWWLVIASTGHVDGDGAELSSCFVRKGYVWRVLESCVLMAVNLI
jgi:hypothetical protein